MKAILAANVHDVVDTRSIELAQCLLYSSITQWRWDDADEKAHICKSGTPAPSPRG